MELEVIFYKNWAKFKEILDKYMPVKIVPKRGIADPAFKGWK